MPSFLDGGKRSVLVAVSFWKPTSSNQILAAVLFLNVGTILTVIYKHKEKIWKGLSETQLQGNSLSFVAFYHYGNFPFLLLWEVQELPLNEMKVIVSCLQYDAVE